MRSAVIAEPWRSGSNTTARARPSFLAWYIAASACRSSVSAVASPSVSDTAMPMLAVTNTSSVVSAIGSATAASSRSASADDRLDAREVVAEHHELVAAEARDDVAGPDRVPEPLRDGHDELVAERVPEAVVDELEVVEVDEQHRDHAVPLPPARAPCATRSVKLDRLGSPVIASCAAS